MSRTVVIEHPDGSKEPITGVPDEYTDEQLAKRYNAKLAGVSAKDLTKSAGSGFLGGFLQTGLAGPKLVTGAAGKVGQYGENEAATESARKSAKLIQAIEAAGAKAGADYQPETKAGRMVKTIAGGAAQLPIGGPANIIKNMALGGLSGLLGQAVGEEYGQGAGAVASMAPFTAQAVKHQLTPNFAARNVVHATNQLTPKQSAEIARLLATARSPQVDLNPMPWQVAGKNTNLRTLGGQGAIQPEADLIQARLQEQLPRANQATVRAATEPDFAKTNPIPVSAAEAQAMRDAVAGVTKKRSLVGPEAEFVKEKAAMFGKEVPLPPEKIKVLIDEYSQLKRTKPRTPEMEARLQDLSDMLLSKKKPLPQEFEPAVANLGEVESARQQLGKTSPGGFAKPGEGSVGDMRKALLGRAEALSPVYAENIGKYGDVKEAVKRTGKSAEAYAGKNIENIGGEARTSAASNILYAGATNPLWAGVPVLREWARKAGAKQLDKYLTQPDLQSTLKMASKDAQAKHLAAALRALMEPAQLGLVDPMMGE